MCIRDSPRTTKRRNPLKRTEHKIRITGLDTDLDHYSPQGPRGDLQDEMEFQGGAVKALHIHKRPPAQGGNLTGTAEVVFYTKADAMACLEASIKKQLYINGSPISAEQMDQNTEEPTAPHGTAQSRITYQ